MARALILCDLVDVEALCLAAVEGLGHRHRSVGEPLLGRQQLDVEQIAGQHAQREQRLEPRDARSRDEDVRTRYWTGPISHCLDDGRARVSRRP